MSYIHTDSMFSSIKNPNLPQDYRPNDSTSNLFRSIFDNMPPKPKSIKIQSIFDIDHHQLNNNRSTHLMDKLITASYRQNPNSFFHYNWMVCKNQGLSEEQDNQEINNQKSHKLSPQIKVKAQPIQYELNLPHQQLLPPASFQKKIKNQTKNIPKNYGKAIISFIQKNRLQVQQILEKLGVDYDDLLDDLKKKKKTINTIADLRSLWSKYQYAKCMRIISFRFLRKFALQYIFDSRICTFNSHIKYRQRLCEAVANPEDFKHIKDY